MSTPNTLTRRQIQALQAGARGNAWAMPGTSMGGAKRRMIRRLVAAGLLTEELPYRATEAGRIAMAQWPVRR